MSFDLRFNFTLNHLLIGILSQPLLFVFGYLASVFLPGNAKDISGLTIWNLSVKKKQDKR